MKTKHHARPGQSGGKTLSNAIGRKWFALRLSGFLFLLVCTLLPSSLKAGCQYDVSGQWTIYQGSFRIPLALSQNGKKISGTASHSSATDTVHGQVTGTIDGDNFDVQINWEGGVAGIYRGTIDQWGYLHGVTYDKNKPSSTAQWFPMAHPFKCVAVNAVLIPPRKVIKPTFPKPPTPVPVTTANDPKVTTPTPSAATKPAAPRITASSANGTGGLTTLTWDGGPDHPYAEVWVAVDGGAPTFMVEQGKGSRSVTVEPGKEYRYILTDSGKDLSTVTVRGK